MRKINDWKTGFNILAEYFYTRGDTQNTMPQRKTKPMPVKTLILADFTKNGNSHTFTDTTGKYTLLLSEKFKTFEVKHNREVIGDGIKGVVNAVNVVNEYRKENEPVKTVVTTNKGKIATTAKPATIGKSAPVEVMETRNGKIVEKKGTPVVSAKSVPAVPAKATTAKPATKAKKILAFPEYEEWEGYPVRKSHETVRRGKTVEVFDETEEEYNKRVKGGKLQWGKARKAYNAEHGLEDVSVPVPAKTTRKAKDEDDDEPTERAPRDFGERGNSFNGGVSPTPLEFLLARRESALGTREYAISFGALHPYGENWKKQFFPAVERIYNLELDIHSIAENTGEKPPKGYEPMYFGKTVSDLDEAEAEAITEHYMVFREANPIYDRKGEPIDPCLEGMLETKKKVTPNRRK